MLDNGLTEGEYIEIVGTVVSIVSIDSLASALGVAERPLPKSHASMLRASSETHDENIDLAEAIVGADASSIATARDRLVAVAGHAVMVDAAVVASNFQRMVRIADSTGITLGQMADETDDLRESLGINKFSVG